MYRSRLAINQLRRSVAIYAVAIVCGGGFAVVIMHAAYTDYAEYRAVERSQRICRYVSYDLIDKIGLWVCAVFAVVLSVLAIMAIQALRPAVFRWLLILPVIIIILDAISGIGLLAGYNVVLPRICR